MTRACNNCGGLVAENLRQATGLHWQCAHCGEAGVYVPFKVDGKAITVREVVKPGDPSKHRAWIAAGNIPYKHRVNS
jgi:hypothetical protein